MLRTTIRILRHHAVTIRVPRPGIELERWISPIHHGFAGTVKKYYHKISNSKRQMYQMQQRAIVAPYQALAVYICAQLLSCQTAV